MSERAQAQERKQNRAMAPRDPVTGRLLPKLSPTLETDARAEFPVSDEEREAFKPVRIWTAGPQLKHRQILVPGGGMLQVRSDYAYYCDTPEKLAAAKRALGREVWYDQVPDGEEWPRCETCGWRSASYAAMNRHLNHAHGKPQA